MADHQERGEWVILVTRVIIRDYSARVKRPHWRVLGIIIIPGVALNVLIVNNRLSSKRMSSECSCMALRYPKPSLCFSQLPAPHSGTVSFTGEGLVPVPPLDRPRPRLTHGQSRSHERTGQGQRAQTSQ